MELDSKCGNSLLRPRLSRLSLLFQTLQREEMASQSHSSKRSYAEANPPRALVAEKSPAQHLQQKNEPTVESGGSLSCPCGMNFGCWLWRQKYTSLTLTWKTFRTMSCWLPRADLAAKHRVGVSSSQQYAFTVLLGTLCEHTHACTHVCTYTHTPLSMSREM